MNYPQALEYIGSFTVPGKPVDGLGRIKTLLAALGNPQDGLDFVHIAGTNGKGSAVEMISSGLISAGVKTGQLTSPFIRHYRDRIRINCIDIPEAEVCRLAGIIRSAEPSRDCSQFEITLALALLWFAEQGCRVVCMEAGIGGLLDATNFVQKPLVSVIMSISPDHTALLGKTEEEIAVQKAGIIKPQCPCVLYPQNSDSVRRILSDTADRVGSAHILPDMHRLEIAGLSGDGGEIIYKDAPYHIAMSGRHQIFNAITAIEAMSLLGLGARDIRAGLSVARVPARMQKIARGVYFDGAHNPGAAEALADSVKLLGGQKPVGVCGMLDTKDYCGCVKRLSDSFSSVVCVDGFAPRAVAATELAACFTSHGVRAYTARSIDDALFSARVIAGEGNVVVFGSLYIYEAIGNSDYGSRFMHPFQ